MSDKAGLLPLAAVLRGPLRVPIRRRRRGSGGLPIDQQFLANLLLCELVFSIAPAIALERQYLTSFIG
jgi:hypothetical protein